MAALTVEDVTVTLRDWLTANVAGWSNVEVIARDVALGSGFSAEIFFVDAEYDTAEGRQSQSLVVRRQPTNFEVVLGSSLALQGQMMAALDARGDVLVPPWIGMELDPTVLGMPFLIMGKVTGSSATQRPNYNSEGWVADMSPAQRGLAWKNGIEAFAQLAHIDWQDGFTFLARPEWGAPGVDQYV
ncbi:MAG: phosphotransferase, partial [Rhizorhabdus sp.]|nr:phosphotransferase [Rhizorhabdus sp.]